MTVSIADTATTWAAVAAIGAAASAFLTLGSILVEGARQRNEEKRRAKGYLIAIRTELETAHVLLVALLRELPRGATSKPLPYSIHNAEQNIGEIGGYYSQLVSSILRATTTLTMVKSIPPHMLGQRLDDIRKASDLAFAAMAKIDESHALNPREFEHVVADTREAAGRIAEWTTNRTQ